MFDLTKHEEAQLLKKGKELGITDRIDLARVAEYVGIETGRGLINYIDICFVQRKSFKPLLRRA